MCLNKTFFLYQFIIKLYNVEKYVNNVTDLLYTNNAFFTKQLKLNWYSKGQAEKDETGFTAYVEDNTEIRYDIDLIVELTKYGFYFIHNECLVSKQIIELLDIKEFQHIPIMIYDKLIPMKIYQLLEMNQYVLINIQDESQLRIYLQTLKDKQKDKDMKIKVKQIICNECIEEKMMIWINRIDMKTFKQYQLNDKINTILYIDETYQPLKSTDRNEQQKSKAILLLQKTLSYMDKYYLQNYNIEDKIRMMIREIKMNS